MVNRKKVQYFNDFTGGLNLTAPRQSLQMNESFDCQDVDFNARGGFTQRCGVGIAADIDWSALDGGYLLGALSFGTDVLLAVSDTYNLLLWDGSTLTTVAAMTDQADRPRFATWGSAAYFFNCWSSGALVQRKRTGVALATLTVLAQTFNDNYTAPVGGCMPLARLGVQHGGYMWVADTVESATRHRSRVRWSHPLQPEDWATADYFDVDPDDETDEITALVPFRSALLVFKKNSVWGIYGSDSDSFVVERLAARGGSCSQESVSVNAGVCYWWSPDGNLFAFAGDAVSPVGDRISAVVRDYDILPFGAHSVAWTDTALWVSLERLVGGFVTLVFDPSVGRVGTWTAYSLSPTSFCWWNTDGTDSLFMTLSDHAGLFTVGDTARVQDEFEYGVYTAIPAYYCTSWFVGGDTSQKKRYRRLRVTAAAEAECTISVGVYHDFRLSLQRTLEIPIVPAVGEAMEWGTGLWGEPWGGGGDEYAFERTPSSGRGHAVMWKFSVSDAATRWWVDSFTIPYLEKGY